MGLYTRKHHISHVCKQIVKSIGVIFRSHFFLSSTIKLTFYNTLIYPYIVYCNSAWSSTYVSNWNRIYYMQKRAEWAITNSDYRTHSAPLFSKLGILDTFQANTFEIAKFMFYYKNNLLPLLLLNPAFCINNLYNSQIHNYDTRTATNYRTHLCRTNLKQFTNSNLLSLQTKCKSFYLNNPWIGLVTHSQHFFFLLFIIVSEVALP